jgi:predicted nucleotidyltransferase
MPPAVRQDLQRVVEILKRHGAVRVILYGSYARGTATAASDLDLCEEGIPAAGYFRAWAEALMSTQTSISILDLASVEGYLRERILRDSVVLYAA